MSNFLRFILALTLTLTTLSASAQSWQKVISSEGPGIAIGGGSGDTLYAGVSAGQVYRSDDNGRTWTLVTTGLVDSFGRIMMPKAFVIGANGRVVRGGVNASWENRVGSPVFYSDNQGGKWTEAPLPFGSPVRNPGGIVVSDMVAHQGALYFSEVFSGGVWKSTDNGETWVSVGDTLPAITELFGIVTKTHYAVAGAGDALLTIQPVRGVFRSTDGGQTWTQAVNGIPGEIESPLVGGRSWTGIDITGAPDGTAFAVVDQNVYRSRDGGASWVEVGAGLFNARKIELSNNSVYVLTEGVNPSFFESTDLGVSWRQLPSLTTGGDAVAEITSQSFAVHNDGLYFAGTDGIYRLDLATATRTNILPLVTSSKTGPILGNIGDSVQVSLSVEGTAPFSYVWQINGTAVNGQNSANLNWPLTSTNDAGQLSVVVSNTAGSVTNVIGQLTIAPKGPGLPDYSFTPQLLTGGFLAASIHAFAIDGDGSVFYGGQNLFSIAGDTYRGLRHASADGSIDAKFVTGQLGGNGTGPATGSPVRTLLPLGDGSVLVGAASSGNNDRYWRRLLPDGSIDPAWPWPDAMAGGPWKAIRLPDGKFLVASGSIGGIHRLNEDGTIDNTFTPPGSIGSFQRNYVRDFVVLPDGKIIIVGNFNTIDNVQRRGIARLFPSGGLDQSFTPADVGSNREISTILLLADGKLLIGGAFTTVGGQPRNGLARLNADGTLDASMPNLLSNGQAFAFALQPDGKVWVGGTFTGVSGRNYLVRLKTDGSVDADFPDVGLNGGVQSLQFTGDGRLWIGSGATTIGGYPGGQLLRIFTDSSGPTLAYAGLNQTPDAGTSIVLQGAASGPFAGAQWRFNGVPISGATSLALPLNNLTAANSGLYDLVLASAGGASTSAPVTIRVRGAIVIDRQPESVVGLVSNSVTFAVSAFGRLPLSYQWMRDGAAIAGATNRTLALTNLSLAVSGDYSVRVTGADDSTVVSETAFLTVIPVPGTRDNSFSSGLFGTSATAGPSITDFILLPDGKILAIGTFALTQNGPLTRMARLNGDGSVDSTFTFDSSPYTEINKIGVQSSGKVILLARLNQGGGPYEARRLLTNGSLDSTFTATSINYPVGLEIGPDDSIFVAHNRLSKLHPDGGLDTGFESKSTFNSALTSLSLDSVGRIYVSGAFTQIAGKSARYVARIRPDGSLDESFIAPNDLPYPTQIRSVSEGVLVQVNGGFFRLDENGARDLTWGYAGAMQLFDLLLDGSVAGFVSSFNSGDGTVLDSQGRPGKPVSSFTVPRSSYTQIRAAADGSFYISQSAFPASYTNALIHVSGTVMPLALVTHPIGQTVNTGETLTLKAAAIGTSAVSYQWQRDGADLPGETGPNLVISNAAMSATGSYRVIVRNRSGTVESRTVQVVVLGTPEILSLSSDATVGVSDLFQLTVNARGVAPLTYQWRRDGVPLPGATHASYTNVSAVIADSGVYDVVISNTLGSITSRGIRISVLVLPGAVVNSFAPITGGVNELAILPDGRILVGKLGGGVNAYTQQGELDTTFATFGGNNTEWREKIAVDRNLGRIYISPASTLRAVDYTGTTVAGFTAPPTNVRLVRLEAAGTILISDNGIRPSLQRLDTNGAVIPGLTPAIQPVTDFWPLPDGKILVLSSSLRIVGFNYAFDTTVARLNSDGTLDGFFQKSDHVFAPNKEASGLRTDSQGRILVWGAFETYLGQPRTSIVRLHADGSLDTSFVPPVIDAGIVDVAEQQNGKLVIVGAFTQVGGLSRSLVARLNTDGSHDTTFSPGTGLTKASGQNIAFDVKLLPEGQIVIGGTFDQANGIERRGIVMLTGDVPGANNSPFQDWATAAGLAGTDADPNADPDGDGIVNQAEFIYGTSPTDADARPLFNVATVTESNQSYPSVTFTRRAGSSVQVEVSQSVLFNNLLPLVEVSVTPAAPGFEQVTVRSSEPQAAASAQFFRLIVR